MAAPLLAAVLCLAPAEAPACGPFFPNTLLDRGDAAVLAAPIADFSSELARLAPTETKFTARPDTNGNQLAETDLADLRAALKKGKVATREKERILAAYKLARFGPDPVPDAGTNAPVQTDTSDPGDDRAVAPDASPRLPAQPSEPIEGLPGEFADYLRGANAWHDGQPDAARAAWEALLARPEAERHSRSTWAAYMLGRYWHGEDPDKAIEYYQQVRELAGHGFADSLGLAASSLGWEAQIHFHRDEYAPAIELYLEQFAAGDGTAGLSLRMVAQAAFRGGVETLRPLAANARTRRVLTAYLISTKSLQEWELPAAEPETDSEEKPNRPGASVRDWLGAVEAANVKDVESAEQLALAAYQAGQWELAQRWINRAWATPAAQWLQAKLLLRAGKTDQAAAVLTRVARLFPPGDGAAKSSAPAGLIESLGMDGHTYLSSWIDAPSAVLGEWGVFQVARREYTEALDALLRAGYWVDAAYVAERVLSVEELQSYVDRNWPAVAEEEKGVALDGPQQDQATGVSGSSDESADDTQPRWKTSQELRYLLARRLTRLHRGIEARDYYPAQWRPDFDALAAALKTGWDESRPAEQRAPALWEAAKLARHKGLELLGTEVEPDWHVHAGDFEDGPTCRSRATNELALRLVASKDELQRAAAHRADPEDRFHYRYQAAFLGWEAAKLMPNNSDDTARVLCTAGSWLKNRDPDTADIFYKALVRRCRKTAIGDQADRMRWFPSLDENGNPIPWKPEPPTEVLPPEPDADPDAGLVPPPEPAAGYSYILHRGNSLQDVVDAVRAAHNVEVTVNDLLQANPGVNPGKLKVGQKILVPAATGQTAPPVAPDEAPPTPAPPPVPDQPPDMKTQEQPSDALSPISSGTPQAGWEYVVQVGDTLTRIAQAFRDRGVPLTIRQMKEANPGFDSERLRVGQKLFIPAPQQGEVRHPNSE